MSSPTPAPPEPRDEQGTPRARVPVWLASVAVGAMVVIALMVAAALFTTSARPHRGLAPTLTVGDCVNLDPDTGPEGKVAAISCHQSHLAQVYDQFELPDGPFPGDDVVVSTTQDECAHRWKVLASTSPGTVKQLAGYRIFDLRPTAKGWSDTRVVTCLASLPGGSTHEVPGLTVRS